MNAIGSTELLVILVILFVISIPLWRIISKTGFPAWLSLVLFIPVANLVLLYYLAFSEWPAFRSGK